jgi:translation initiation factor 4G
MSLKTRVTLKLHTKTRWFDLPPPNFVDNKAVKKKVFIDVFGRECWEVHAGVSSVPVEDLMGESSVEESPNEAELESLCLESADFSSPGPSTLQTEEMEPETDEVVLRKASMILNDLSLTRFAELSDTFIDTGIVRNEQCLAGAIELIVKKAHDEPHSAELCADLCVKLSRTPMEFEEEIVAGEGMKKTFKKMLLNKCQHEFKMDVSYRIEKAIEGVKDDEERHLMKYLAKKQYLGHLMFMGELYIRKLISIKIIFMILTQLSNGNDENGTEDAEKVDCFSTLMTVVGLTLEQDCVDLWYNGNVDAIDMLEACWNAVENAKAVVVSNLCFKIY